LLPRLRHLNSSALQLLNDRVLTKTKNFFNEVKVELQKASWPWEPKEKGIRRYKELTDSTVVVIVAMLLMGGYVALFDFVLVNVIHFFTRMH
jgi:preprotein translocase subunit SecE